MLVTFDLDLLRLYEVNAC